MAIVPVAAAYGSLVELEDIGSSVESLARLVESQKELFHSQIDQLQKIVVTQCKLTGANPLAQEMAAGALSVKIGKKPRDLLNPKAVKYMQTIFSIKDTIGKKESREISAFCGITVTQVKDYFSSQRANVRKLVRLSHEKATKCDESKTAVDECSISPLHSVPPGIVAANGTVVPGSILNVTPVQDVQLAPTKTILRPVEEGPSKSLQEETTPGVDSEDKKFLENIFNLMRKEQTFSGREKLMEWVLQIHNSAVLSWFLTKGGITILAGWLSEAALEEQTTVLLIIFKVFCHLPLNKAQPVQMSDILKTVNKLRFYRSSDISNRAKVLLARWSNMFFKSHSQKNSRNSLKNGQKEMIRNKQRTNEVLGEKSWQSKLGTSEDILALAESAEDSREPEPKKGLKLLTDSSDGSSRKHGRNVSATKIKERRKVLLVEHPDSKAGRSPPTARAVPSNNSRPMSADDIQKAKMRASFMQDKYGMNNLPASENIPQKIEGQKAPPASLPENRKPQLPQMRTNEIKKSPIPTMRSLPHKPEASRNLKTTSTSQEQLLEKLKRNHIQWRTPPEVRLNSSWRVGTGENSKEVQMQTQRNKREKETFFPNPQDVPLNPKEPWDVEMDFDDTLTPEIPIDQLQDSESPLCSPTIDGAANASAVVDGLPSTSSVSETAITPQPAATGSADLEPDPELLAVLLKVPVMVESLTTGDARNLSNEQKVVVLDMLKKAATGAAGVLNGLVNIPVERPCEPESEQFSFPSPTPPSNATRTIWRTDFSSEASTSASQSQPQFVRNRGVPFVPTVSPSTPVILMGGNCYQTATALAVNHHTLTMAPQTPATVLSLPQLTVTGNPPPQQHQPVPNLLPTMPPPMYAPLQQSRVPETIIPPNHYPVNHPSIPFNSPQFSEPPAFLPSPAWPPANNAAGFAGQDPLPDYWNGGGRLDDPAINTNYYANRNIYNNNSHNVYPRRNEYAPRPAMGTRSPEGSQAVGPRPEFQDFPYDRVYLEPRREFDRRGHHDWSRQRKWNSGQQSQYRGGGGGGGGGRRRWRR